MSARDDLEQRLIRDAGLSPHWAKRQVDTFAHELAEQIRNTPSPDNPDDYGGFVDQGADWAADLIDPEVADDDSAVPMRPADGTAPTLRLVGNDVCNAALQGWPIEVVDECVREAGHYDEADPENWHESGPDPDGTRRRWSDSASGATPHRAGSVRPDEEPTP